MIRPRLLLALASTLIAGSLQVASAATFVSANSGPWNNPSTWSVSGPDDNGIPDAGDSVTVAFGHTVTVDGYNAEALDLNLSHGNLSFSSSGASPILRVMESTTINDGGKLDIHEGPVGTVIELSTKHLIVNGGGQFNGHGTLPTSIQRTRIEGNLSVDVGAGFAPEGIVFIFTGPIVSNILGSSSELTLAAIWLEGNTSLNLHRPIRLVEHVTLPYGTSGITISNGSVFTPNGQTVRMVNGVALRNYHHTNGYNDPTNTSTLIFEGSGDASIETNVGTKMTRLGSLIVDGDSLTVRSKVTLVGNLIITPSGRLLVENPPSSVAEINVSGDFVMDNGAFFDAINKQRGMDVGEGSIVALAYDGNSTISIHPGRSRASFSHIQLYENASLFDANPDAVIHFQHLNMRRKAMITSMATYQGLGRTHSFGDLVGSSLQFTNGGDMAQGQTTLRMTRISEQEVGNPATQIPLKEYWEVHSDHNPTANGATVEVANLTLAQRCGNHNDAFVFGPYVFGVGFQTAGRTSSRPRLTTPKFLSRSGTVTRNDILPFVSPLEPAPVETNDPVLWTYNCDSVPVPLSVELISFDAEYNEAAGAVVLSWETAGEIDNAGFRVYSATILEDGSTIVGRELTDAAIAAQGSPVNGGFYHFTDPEPILAGEVVRAYYLEDIDTAGTRTMHEPAVAELPKNVGDPADVAENVLATLSPKEWESYTPLEGISFSGESLGEGLTIKMDGSGIGFGLWQTKDDLPALSAGNYKVTVRIEPLPADGLLLPQARVRAFPASHLLSSMTVATQMSQNGSMPDTIETLFTSDGASPWRIAIDLLSGAENRGGGFRIYSVDVTPLN